MNRSTQQYELGQYMTPAGVAHKLLDLVELPPAEWYVLDPACGDGNLLVAAAERLLEAGVENVASRLMGIDVDPAMIDKARSRLADMLQARPRDLHLVNGDFLEHDHSLFEEPLLGSFEPNVVISNPPYGKTREYQFFEEVNRRLRPGTETVFLVPQAFMDRLVGGHVVPLHGRPLGVTTGHCLVHHEVGQPYRLRPVRGGRTNEREFEVLSGVKLYEKGAGNPPQDEATLRAKPYSSASPRPGWFPCVRTGDIHRNTVSLERLWVDWGPHLAHPKDLERFCGPRLFVRRVPLWKDRQLGAVFLDETALCAGDVLVVRHKRDDVELLRGLCDYLNSSEAAEAILARRPSVRHRMSFPKISGKDLNALFDNELPTDDELRARARPFHPSSLVGFPTEEISTASAKEKSVRHGHLGTLQFWWARRPLAVCRSAIFAMLRPEPDQVDASPDLSARLQAADLEGTNTRERLDCLTGRISWWSSTGDEELLGLARDLIRLDRAVAPVCLDPFAGGGSIPVEAQRLGLKSVASELNPVAVAALRLALEHLPDSGDEVLESYERAAAKVEVLVARRTASTYKAKRALSPLAFFWCRTYTCPHCGAEAPLLRDRLLARSPRRAVVHLEPTAKGKIESQVSFPASEAEVRAASKGTVSAHGAVCVGCSTKTPTSFLQSEGMEGRLGETLYAVCEVGKDGERTYRAATPADARRAARAKLSDVEDRDQTRVPDVEFDLNGIRHIWAMQYGVTSTGQLYTRRQSVALLELFQAVREVLEEEEERLDDKGANALALLLAVTFNRVVMYGNKHSWWQPNGEFPANIFVRQAISMVWSFVEIPVTTSGAAGWSSAVGWIKKAAGHLAKLPAAGTVIRADASDVGLPTASVDIVVTDPPYYDSITYAYLADVFAAWMRPLLEDRLPEDFDEHVLSRRSEAIVDRPHALAPSPKTDAHFRSKMRGAFQESRRVLKPNGSMLVMFGHKKAEAWAAFFGPLLEAGFEPVESWPVHTERKVKFRHARISALSSSCLILCRPRRKEGEAHRVSWADFLTSFRTTMLQAMRELGVQLFSGPDLSAALMARAVREFASHDVLLDEEKTMSLDQFFRELPNIIRTCEQQFVGAELESLEDRDGNDVSLTLDELSGSWLSANGKGLLLDAAIAHAKALDEGSIDRADEVAGTVDVEHLSTALRLAALKSEPGSKEEQMAHASMGRLALQLRSAAGTAMASAQTMRP